MTTAPDNWHVIETKSDPQTHHHKETVFTVGNGYLGTRGTFEEGYPGDRPATLVHGVFDDVPIGKTELANAPNWLIFVLLVNGERFKLDRGTVLSYHRDLDLRAGVLTRSVRWRSPGGHTVDLAIERFASLADRHLLGIRYQVTALDFEGIIELRAGLDGHMLNPEIYHWHMEDQGTAGDQGVYLHMRTRSSNIGLCEACHLVVTGVAGVRYTCLDCDGAPAVVASLNVRPGDRVVADKLVALVTSREADDVRQAALVKLEEAVARGYDDVRSANDTAWESEWEACNVVIEGDDEADLAVRYSLFQLLIAAPRHDDRVSIPAKTLSGFGYRGHVFWDTEVFIVPFFTVTRPEIARDLLMYRYHTLPAARRKAEESGYEGALFAWESADTGDETTPSIVPGPDGELVRIWTGDIQYHISADVAYATMRYWQVTGDDAFLRDYGAEIVLDTARFWGSRVEWNAQQSRYEINDTIGPDEYHEHVNNSVFTNCLARWNLEAGLELLDWLRRQYPGRAAELEARLSLTQEHLAHWADVIGHLYIPYDPGTGLMEQFEGFFDLDDIDLSEYESRHTSMQMLLGVKETQRYQVIKQPDVLMLFCLLEDRYGQDVLQANWDYYTPRTDHAYGSSLGPAIQALLAARLGKVALAHNHFIHAARTDLQDVRGNAVDGIHAATAGGLWQAVVFGFAGLRVGEKGYTVTPHLPAHWERLSISFHYRGENIRLVLPHNDTTKQHRYPD
jgi:trehalose/maltose hydrolase-like predicted phosphorylase